MFGTKTCTIELEFIKNEISLKEKEYEENLIKLELLELFEQKRFITKKKTHLSIGRLVKGLTQTQIFIEIPTNINKKFLVDLFLGILDILTEDFQYEYKEIRFSDNKFKKDFIYELSKESPELFDRFN